LTESFISELRGRNPPAWTGGTFVKFTPAGAELFA
jgi:hypothetical protein